MAFLKTCNCCRETYDQSQWDDLASLGSVGPYEEDDGTLVELEMKNCACGSTLGVERVLEADS